MLDSDYPIAVFISGSGSNLQAIVDHIQNKNIHANICCVISNTTDAYGLVRAKNANIPTHIVLQSEFLSREQYDQELIKILQVYNVKLIVLAGFMRVLSKTFIQKYPDNIINIHPSLLPKFTGLNTHKRVIEAGESEHGCSVHFVNEYLDAGPIIIQASVPVKTTDTSETLAERVLKKEHVIYPLVVKWFTENRLQFKNNTIHFEDKILEKPILLSPQYEAELQCIN